MVLEDMSGAKLENIGVSVKFISYTSISKGNNYLFLFTNTRLLYFVVFYHKTLKAYGPK